MSTTTSAAIEPSAPQRCQGRVAHLILRCGQGDEAALGDLFDLTYFVVAAAVNPGGVWSAEADQAVMEAFWRIWRRSPSYVPSEAGVVAWVLEQAHDTTASASVNLPRGEGALRVAVLSEYHLMRAGLSRLLSTDTVTVSVVEGPDQVGHAGSHDVVVYDLADESRISMDALAALLVRGVPVVAVTSYGDSHLAETVLAMGVVETVRLDVNADGLVEAIKRAAAGQKTTVEAHRSRRRHAARAGTGLTDRETAVLELIGAGVPNQEIADTLYLSTNTIKTYIRNAYRKIGVSRRAQAVLWAARHDLVPLSRTGG
jgi:DNA-binding NarL/FixJ family response regulator